MTVGELVYQIATKDGYTPTFSDGFVSALNKATEDTQKFAQIMKGPLANINTMMESLRPQMEAISKMSFPTIHLPSTPSIPSALIENDEEDSFFPVLTRPVQDVRIVNYREMDEVKSASETKLTRALYTLPPNARPESLLIEFIDGHNVRVSYPNMDSDVFDFKDMGFLDRKNKIHPDTKWKLLQAMAEHGGSLTKAYWDKKFTKNIKYELDRRLRHFFGVDTSFIENYTKRNGYVAIFTLRWDK